MRRCRTLSVACTLALVLGFSADTAVVANTGNDPALTAAQETRSGPTGQAMALLESYLERYGQIALQGGWPALPAGAKLETGDRDARVPVVREILRRTGDADMRDPADPELYDETLAAAVWQFQERHGLEPDGVLGRRTQVALNVPVERRIAEIRATLERMQEMLPRQDERHILVNLPGYYLEAVEGGEVRLHSKVIVGAPGHPTPLLGSRPITYVKFNPTWRVPYRIATRELLKKQQEDPEYLQKERFTVVHADDGEQTPVDPATIDWTQVSSRDFPYRLEQQAGADNALGKIKFTLPDSDDIYLHSTGAPKLFAKTERSLSHGCVRVEKARELAHFVLADNEKWPAEKIDQTYDGSEMKLVKATPVPVYFVYWAVWADRESGLLHFHPDIYRRDQKRVAELMQETEPALKVAAN